jgi:uncharacterized protein YigE (DUF2233 family)
MRPAERPCGIEIDLRPAFTYLTAYRVTPGVTWRRTEQGTGERFLLINVLEAKLSDKAVSLDVGLPEGRGREETSGIARRAGALAAVNGGFFHGTGTPLGLVIKNGALIAKDVSWRPPRTALGVTPAKRILINRVRWGNNGPQSILQEDDRPVPLDAWGCVTTALGGGPRLVLNGKAHLTTDDEALGPGGNDITREAARTAAGVTRDGKLILALVSGYRDNHSQGMRLEEAGDMMVRLGALDAMALDGGTSSTMVLMGRRVSASPGGKAPECPVGDALLLHDEGKPLLPYMINLNFSIDSLPADGASTAFLEGRLVDALGKRVPPWTVVTLETDPAGLLPHRVKVKRGKLRLPFKSLRLPGIMTVNASCGLGSGSASIRLTAGAPARLFHRVVPESEPGAFIIEVLLTDDYLNPLEGQAVTAAPAQGDTTVLAPPALTDEDGASQAHVLLRSRNGAVVVGAGGLKPITVTLELEPAKGP